VTIAAGFNFQDGVLICADTKHSASFTLDASKIFAREHANGVATVFAYAGTMRYCRMAIQSFESAISALKPRNTSLSRILDCIKKELRDLHKNNLYPHPGFGTGSPSISFIAAVWSPKDGLLSLSIEDASVMEFPGYDCLGSGDYLGHYLVRSRYKNASKPLSLEKVTLIAAQMLMSIKGYDEDCGGDSELVVLSKNGKLSPVRILNITKGEHYSKHFYKAVDLLYFALSDPRTTDEQMAAHLHAFQCNLKSIRRVGKEIQDVIDGFGAAKLPEPDA
jgi:hypothetical protein